MVAVAVTTRCRTIQSIEAFQDLGGALKA